MSFSIKAEVQISVDKMMLQMGLGVDRRAQRYLAGNIAALCDPYVPFESGKLKNSYRISRDGREIVYPGPYAHYQYVGEVMAGSAPKHYTGRAIDYDDSPMRGREWDKRMWADRHDEVLRSLVRYIEKRARGWSVYGDD